MYVMYMSVRKITNRNRFCGCLNMKIPASPNFEVMSIFCKHKKIEMSTALWTKKKFKNMVKNEVFPIFLEIFTNDQKKIFYQKNSQIHIIFWGKRNF